MPPAQDPSTARSSFSAETGTGALGGWVAGDGLPVLMLHGGPGLSFDYLDDLATELVDGCRVASFQQRGLAPSTTEGAFTIAEAVDDVVAVLDALWWDHAHVLGHSYGGHLALHVAAAAPSRVAGALVVDPLGAVGDGGAAEFGAQLRGRVASPKHLARIEEIEAEEEAGTATPEEELESLSLVWPSYFADPASAPPMPPVELSLPAHEGLWADLVAQQPALEAALPAIDLPFGFVHGAGSPMPVTASTDSAARIPGAWTEVVEGAGHFVWLERPGAVRAALDRLTGSGSA